MKKSNLFLKLIAILLLSVVLSSCQSSGSGSGDSTSDAGSQIDDGEAPDRVNLDSVTVLSFQSIEIVWQTGSDNIAVSGYDIYRNETNIASVNSADTIFTDTDLDPETLYCYEITAYDAAGNQSPASSQLCETTLEDSACGYEGLDLTLSDLVFPSTVNDGSSEDGSVAYQGTFNDVATPRMLTRVYTGSSIITSYSFNAPTISNCRIRFVGVIPSDVSGSGNVYFKLVDSSLSGSNIWDDKGVSNEISAAVTIK